MQFETAAAPAPSPPVSDHLKLLRAKVLHEVMTAGPAYTQIACTASTLHCLSHHLGSRMQGYPYPRPDSSFVFVNGETYEFDDSQWLGAGGLEWLKIDTAQGRLRYAYAASGC